MTDEEKKALEAEAAVEAAEKAAAEAAEKAKPEAGKEKEPVDLEKELEAEAEKINEEIKVEKKEPEVKEKKEVAKVEKVEDEPITPEFRAKYKVPENIKTFKALAEWGPNAEANMKKSLSEKDKTAAALQKTEERIAKMEETLKALNEKKVEAGTMTEEERAIENEKLRYLLENDPVKYAEELKKSIRQETLTEHQKQQEVQIKEQNEKALIEIRGKQAEEWLEITKEFEDKGEKDRFENEVFPALKKIAAENPGMTSWKTAFKIYRLDAQEAEAKIKAEEEVKRKEKEAEISETSHHSADVGDVAQSKAVKAINEAQSIEELDRAAGL